MVNKSLINSLTNKKTYVIAEIGLNHNGNLDEALSLVDAAARAGVDAVKFQTYISEKRAPKGDNEMLGILKKLELEFSNFGIIKKYADDLGIEFFSTAFDLESVSYLESINVGLYKVASFDIANYKLLNSIADTRKPIIFSTGMATEQEIKSAYNIFCGKSKHIGILHCVSSYPTEPADAHLSNIFDLQANYDCSIGQSDHTNSIDVPLYAVCAGASIVEKHFKISDSHKCIDSSVSITEKQMSQLVTTIRNIENIFGNVEYGVRENEKGAEKFKRYS